MMVTVRASRLVLVVYFRPMVNPRFVAIERSDRVCSMGKISLSPVCIARRVGCICFFSAIIFVFYICLFNFVSQNYNQRFTCEPLFPLKDVKTIHIWVESK